MKPTMTRDQRTAVEAVVGDVAISAAAGSGKTTVLAHRFAHAMKVHPAQGWDPARIDQILTITFTNKAAGEIAERVRRVVNSEISVEAGRRVGEAWISTIHTFCARLVRRHLLEAGVEPRFAQIDDVASALLKAEAFETTARGLYGQHAGSTRLLDTSALSALRQDVIDVHDNIRAMGLDPRQVRVPSGLEEIEDLRLAAAVRADALRRTLGECAQTETVTRKRAALDEWCERLGACALGEAHSCEQLEALGRDYDIKNLSGAANLANRELRSALEVMVSAARAAAEDELLEGYRALVESFTESYARLKAERSSLDFDDLQERAIGLLDAHPALAKRYRDHFRLLMIDEFQDTNELQLRVIESLRGNNLCVVGDERQSIYGFRYADVEVFERVRAQIATKVELSQNFRSHPAILGFVNHAFSQPHLFGADFMRLDAGPKGGRWSPLSSPAPRVECVLLDATAAKKAIVVAEEAKLVSRRIGELVGAGARAGDIAILLRNANNAALFAEALEGEGVPVLVSAGVALFDAEEVLELMALLRAIAVPTDDEALVNVLASRFVRLSDDGLLALRIDAGHEPLWSALRAAGEGEVGASALSADDEAAARLAYRAIDELGAQQGLLSLHETVHAACEAFDYDLTLLSQGPAGLRAWSNVLKIARYAQQFEQVESSDPAAFVEYLAVRRDGSKDRAAAAEAGGDAVRIMTIHSAKGLEFPAVFVADLGAAKARAAGNAIVSKVDEDGRVVPVLGVRLPGDEDGGCAATAVYHRLSDERWSRELEEQKRCLYVACTRAEELLVVSGAANLAEPAAEGSSIIDWVRESLGDPGESGLVACGDSQVAVTIAEAQRGAAGHRHGPRQAGRTALRGCRSRVRPRRPPPRHRRAGSRTRHCTHTSSVRFRITCGSNLA